MNVYVLKVQSSFIDEVIFRIFYNENELEKANSFKSQLNELYGESITSSLFLVDIADIIDDFKLKDKS
jgi:hypothetical protein